MGLLRIGKSLRLVRDCQKSMPPKAEAWAMEDDEKQSWRPGCGAWRLIK